MSSGRAEVGGESDQGRESSRWLPGPCHAKTSRLPPSGDEAIPSIGIFGQWGFTQAERLEPSGLCNDRLSLVARGCSWSPRIINRESSDVWRNDSTFGAWRAELGVKSYGNVNSMRLGFH